MESHDKLFLDTDTALDHLTDRQPFAEYAHRLLALAESNEISLFTSPISFSNLYYLLRKFSGHATAVDLLLKLRCLVHVLPVGESEIDLSLGSRFRDFEDAIQYHAALQETGITAIITRNKSDYTSSALPIKTAEEYLFSRK